MTASCHMGTTPNGAGTPLARAAREPVSTAGHCATCTEEGRRGYCARLRCYCGHETCHAFDSYEEPPRLNVVGIEARAAARAQREEPS